MKYALVVIIASTAACGFAIAAAPSQPPQQSQQSQQGSQQQQPPQQQQRQSDRPARPPTYSDRYSILTQRNIFLKDRSRGGRNGSTTAPTTSASSTQPARRPPEETLLLRGIVVEDGEVRAYFEDIVNSKMLRVAEGESVARGRITHIGLDAVEYEPKAANGGAAAKPTLVVVGTDLTGKISALDDGSAAAAASVAGGAGATTGPVMPSGLEGINPNDPNLTLEQRLKLRRMQELKK